MPEHNKISMQLSKRGLIIGTSYLAALLLVLGAGAGANYARAEQYRVLLEDNYSGSLSGLSSSLSDISAALQKGRYAASPVQISYLAANLWKDASAAKTALGSLPVGELHLERTNEFLSQVGDYAMALSRKSVAGGEISRQEREQFAQLYQYGLTLADQVNGLEQELRQNAVTMESIKDEIRQMNTAGAQPAQESRVGAFMALEDALAGYPSLMYDGPFSTHIAKRSPLMLQNAQAVPQETALKNAARAAGVEFSALQYQGDENSLLASYTFAGDGVWTGVTKAGGHVVYVMKSRMPVETNLEPYTALSYAANYLETLGFENLLPTYYEIGNNVCTASFVSTQGDVLLYPDLVKVEIALDNGEVLGLDARGYLYNHTARPLVKPALAAQTAQSALNSALTVERARLAIIPTAGLGEVFCWEFTATSEEGERVLAYVNANTGVEEQLLLLPADGAGTALL